MGIQSPARGTWPAIEVARVASVLAGVMPNRDDAGTGPSLVRCPRLAPARRAAAARARAGPPSRPCAALDAIHARIEAPAEKLLRSVEPWSSYVVLPIFALANAGVAWSLGVLEGRGRLIGAIALGLVLGKPIGISLAAWLAGRRRAPDDRSSRADESGVGSRRTGMVCREVRETGRGTSRTGPSGRLIRHPASRPPQSCRFCLDTGMRPVSNACSGETVEGLGNEVNAHLRNIGLTFAADPVPPRRNVCQP